MNTRCASTFDDNGSTLLCLKDSGHGGMHEYGDWEWWDELSTGPAPSTDEAIAKIDATPLIRPGETGAVTEPK